jgi:TrmH family RNA methyltransferase
MLSKAVIKYINSLKINKFRNKHRIFVAEGTKTVLDILHSDIKTTALYATADWLHDHREFIPGPTVSLFEISEKEMGAISSLTTPQNVLILAEIPKREIDPVELSGQLVLMLDNIRDPGNLGTMIRTADWFGIGHILCSISCVDAFNPKVVQATMGSIARIHIHYADLEQLLAQLKPLMHIYGCLLNGVDINTATLGQTGILLIGNESEGITSNLIPFIDTRLTIPSYSMHSGTYMSAESLNAAQACSIVCYAFRT